MPDLSDCVTQDTLHHGRISYWQFKKGYRTGLEPVLLAAFVPAHQGESVLEAGCGAGAGLLCLNARIPGLYLAGIEADADTATLARDNLARNNVRNFTVFNAEIPVMPTDLRQACHNANGRFHHAFANPPWHAQNSTPSSHPRRRKALFCDAQGWAAWILALAGWILPGGTLSLALPTSALAEAMASLQSAGFGSVTIVPLWPKVGRRTKIVLIQAVLGGRSGTIVSPGLTIHEDDGQYTTQTHRILRDGGALSA